MKIARWIHLAPLFFTIAVLDMGCAPPPPKPPKSALETREFQTRHFEVGDPRLVMKAVVNVLQDEGYIVRNAVPDLGLITASKEIAAEEQSTGFPSLSFGFGAGYSSWGTGWGESLGSAPRDRPGRALSVSEASVNVTESGKGCRVRVNFLKKVIDGYGAIREAQADEDPASYQRFFAKVDQSIYLQRERL